MVGIPARMRTLRGKLALVRNGFGAAVLPGNVQRLTLLLAHKLNEGHMGPRKFWRLYLPRLKYHNPALQVEVVRERDKGGPATLTVEFDGNRKETLNVQHKHENDIIAELFKLTDARPLPIDEHDSQLAQEYLDARRHEQATAAAREAKRAKLREEKKLGALAG